jgi:hypothetical protein
MDAQTVRDLAEELRFLARAKPAWKPTLHRAARALELNLPREEKVQRGRYGGRPLVRPVVVERPRAVQEALL